MEKYESALNEIREIVESITGLTNAAYLHYSALVDAVLRDEITDAKQIARIMDGLVDFGDDNRFIDIYRKLCRHVYYNYPELVGEHVALFLAISKTEAGEDKLQLEPTSIVDELLNDVVQKTGLSDGELKDRTQALISAIGERIIEQQMS